MKTICKWSCFCLAAFFMLLAMNLGSAEAGRWRRIHVVEPHIHVAPRDHHHPRIDIVVPGVRVQVGRGVRVDVGGWYRGWHRSW